MLHRIKICNKCDISYHVIYRTFRINMASSFFKSGFKTNSFMPMDFALSSVIILLWPVHRIMGISGRISLEDITLFTKDLLEHLGYQAKSKTEP